jgi:energy-coupling factor transporter ATP-binding protein EcfA2
MPYQRIEIKGLRGFSTSQSLDLASPTGQSGSGLTVVVGPNNAGKSTVVEALRVFSSSQAPSFMEGKRNKAAGDRVRLELIENAESRFVLRTIDAGGSETLWEGAAPAARILVLPSRRHFNVSFGKAEYARSQYTANMANTANRGDAINTFGYRLFSIQKNRAAFNSVLSKVLEPVPHWVIELASDNQYYLKFTSAGQTHSSEGLGEGYLSLFFIIDALYDSSEGDTIVIDEPELSLHPALQRRLNALIADYAATRQVVVSTHSPYFLDFESLANGGKVARIHFAESGSVISQLGEATGKKLTGLLDDLRNPHVLGLDAKEAFFLDDGAWLLEGQDDVVHYRRIAELLGLTLPGSFFGWGVGGADKMRLLATALKELGFAKVVGIVDSDRASLASELSKEFPNYRFAAIPAKDVRTKEGRVAAAAVFGLLDEDGQLRKEYAEETQRILEGAVAYLRPEQPPI